jgi:hypothetical protein
VTSPAPETPAAAPGRPEPVLGAAGVASALTSAAGALLIVLVATHVITPEGSAVLGPVLASAVPTAVGAVATLLAALHARGKVTPLAAPVSAAGLALVEVGEDVAAALAEATRRPGPQTPGVADHAAPEAG